MQQPRLSLYNIDMKYVRNLAKVDNNVMSTSPQIGKENRPFVGVLILLNNRYYCIPLTSPKLKFESKKNSVDFMKIPHPTEKNENGSHKLIGGLNINNMIPVDISVLRKIDLQLRKEDNTAIKEYKELMKDQLSFCQMNQDLILKRANNLYDLVTNYPDKNRNLTRRCCDFVKLEKVLDKYISKSQSVERQAPISISKMKANAKKISNKTKSNPTKKKEHDL